MPGKQKHSIPFKQKYSFDLRKHEAMRIKNKYPNRIPIIVEKSTTGSSIPAIDKQKFLVPSDLSLGQFIYVMRKRMKLAEEKAIFVYVAKNALPPVTESMEAIYEAHSDEDGFLYLSYAGENTFG